MLYRIVNFLCFQAGWFACVLGAAHGMPLVGPAVVGGWVIVHLCLSRSRRSELIVLVGAALLGCVADSILSLAGLLHFEGIYVALLPVPLWMIALWVNLAATLSASLYFLRDRYFLAAILGCVGGPLAYLAGDRLGALRPGDPTPWSLIAIGLEWAVAMPTLLAMDSAARRLTGDCSSPPRSHGPIPAEDSDSPRSDAGGRP